MSSPELGITQKTLQKKVSALDTGLGENYGSAVDAHKSELEKAAMRQRIRELEEELLNANTEKNRWHVCIGMNHQSLY